MFVTKSTGSDVPRCVSSYGEGLSRRFVCRWGCSLAKKAEMDQFRSSIPNSSGRNRGRPVFSPRIKPSLWKKSRNFLWPAMGVKRAWHYIMHRIARIRVTPHRLAIGFAAGVFVSFTPFIGFHFILAALTAVLVRGNLIASVIGTAVGNPITFPFIWIASYNLGALFLGLAAKDKLEIHLTDESVGIWNDGPIAFLQMLWNSVEPVIMPMLLGGIPLGVFCAAICYFFVRSTVQELKSRRTFRRTTLE